MSIRPGREELVRAARLVLAVLLSLALTACGGTTDAVRGARAADTVDIKARDGVVLKASYFSPGTSGPAILLFHQCNMDRHAWDGLAGDLAAAGFHVLAVDQRGFGESGRGLSQADGSRQLDDDADAVYENLLSHPGVDRQRVAAGGASCGVTESVDLATRHHEIKALLLLSGNASQAGLAYIAATSSLPVFGATSQYDASAGDIREAVKASKHSNSTLKELPDNWFNFIIGRQAHGVVLFSRNPDLKPVVVKWLQTQLAPGTK